MADRFIPLDEITRRQEEARNDPAYAVPCWGIQRERMEREIANHVGDAIFAKCNYSDFIEVQNVLTNRTTPEELAAYTPSASDFVCLTQADNAQCLEPIANRLMYDNRDLKEVPPPNLQEVFYHSHLVALNEIPAMDSRSLETADNWQFCI